MPPRDNRLFIQIYDCDLKFAGHIHERSTTFFFQLKRLWMGIKLNYSAPGSICLEDGECPRSVPHDDVAGSDIEPNIIGVVSKFDGSEGFEAGCVEYRHSPIASRRDEKPVRQTVKQYALWLLKTRNAAERLKSLSVNHFNRMVSERGHEDPVTLQVG